jgi:amino acid permease
VPDREILKVNVQINRDKRESIFQSRWIGKGYPNYNSPWHRSYSYYRSGTLAFMGTDESPAVVDSAPSDSPTEELTLDSSLTASLATNHDHHGPSTDDNGESQEMFVVPHTDDSIPSRRGTISSARFNILSTMVGGGCLSLPLAFQQSGNGLLGPLLLILTGVITDFCFRLLVASAVHLNPPHARLPGKDSFESVTSAAFGPKAYVMSMGLVTAMCFFGAVGYSVLLRDMMEPLNDYWPLSGALSHGWIHKNFTLFLIILVVTPACTLTNFTALQKCGAASMTSILILGTCIVIRSVQCNVHAPHPWYTYVTFLPESPRDLLNALPLYISCFVCHYNILPVHNELKDPTRARVSWWLRSTTWFAIILYTIMGFAGSTYGHCTPSGKVQGNVLLDFDKNDSLLLVGRMCLAVTITLAFPMLVIPARDILLRSVILPRLYPTSANGNSASTDRDETTAQLQEPLLADEERPEVDNATTEDTISTLAPFGLRLVTSIGIFWTAGLMASCVASIDIVWDLLGSSLSILLSYLIPAGCYLVVMKDVHDTTTKWSKVICWLLIVVFVPLMVISTGNAIANTFFS